MSPILVSRSPTESSSFIDQLKDPLFTIILETKPESIVLLRHPVSGRITLLLSRTNSSFIYYFAIDEGQSAKSPRELGKQNLAPNSNSWVAFTPSFLAPHPTDSTLMAIATSSVPHMKLIIVRLLFPEWESTSMQTDIEISGQSSMLGARALRAQVETRPKVSRR